MPHDTFHEEYTYARGRILAAIQEHRATWTPSLLRAPTSMHDFKMKELKRSFMRLPIVLGPNGFDARHPGTLDRFRDAWVNAARGRSEADVILELFDYGPGLPAGLREDPITYAAAAKLIRHCYRVDRMGGQTVWVVAQPVSYTQFTSDQVWAASGNDVTLRAALNDTSRYFNTAVRNGLCNTTFWVRQWCSNAYHCLSLAEGGNQQQRDKVELWFGAPNMSAALLNMIIAELKRGFRNIYNRIADNAVTFVERPQDRTDTGTLAFVFKGERFPSIYIQRNLLTHVEPHFSAQVYQAVTVLHELSHRIMDSDDHRYDFQHLALNPNFHVGHAWNNADSIAFYAADCANHMTPARLNHVRGGHVTHHHGPHHHH